MRLCPFCSSSRSKKEANKLSLLERIATTTTGVEQSSNSMPAGHHQQADLQVCTAPIAEVRLHERKPRSSRKARHQKEADNGGQPPEPQFATLQELFRYKFGQKSQQQATPGEQLSQNLNEDENIMYINEQSNNKFKTRIPVMKLTKDDWNVKCWEDRLKPAYLRAPRGEKQANSAGGGASSCANRVLSKRASSLEEPADSATGKQIKIFNQRIDDVSMKLDKIRVGEPMDEKLHELTTNKFKRKQAAKEQQQQQKQACEHSHRDAASSCAHRVARESHGWIELLKGELQSGAHNPQVLRSELVSKLVLPQQEAKSVLGRPIRRIFEDDDNN